MPFKRMGRLEALKAIWMDGHVERSTLAGYRRVTRALQSLGCDEFELNYLLQHFDYHGTDGKPYKVLQELLDKDAAKKRARKEAA